MQIGFTSTTFRQIRDIGKVVSIAVSSGADCIEWGGDIHVKTLADAKNAKLLCDAAGIPISSYGSYYRIGSFDKDGWKRICEISAAMDAKAVRVWLGTKDSEKTDNKTYHMLVADTKAICEEASRYGLFVSPECHDNTFNNNTDAFLRLHKDAESENLRTYFQSRYRKKEYDLDRIERTLPYIESVHISYSEQSREQFPKSDPTYIDALLDKLLQVGFDGNILLEYTYLFGRFGIPSCMIKDLAKLRERTGK